jgi:uncharacterized protein YcbK (DUF882 family)
MKNPLVSKNRAAAELREKANVLRAELSNPETVFTSEEVEKRVADIRAIEMRAAAAAEFTADAEVSRQGGDEGLTRVDRNGQREEFAGMEGAHEKAAKIVKEGFRSMGSYVRAIARCRKPCRSRCAPRTGCTDPYHYGFEQRWRVPASAHAGR